MKINRLFEIVYILLEKKRITAGELADYFEVTRRTIYRDIEDLSASGIPIYMTKGKGGGISLLQNFILNKTVITDKERQDILSSLQAVKNLGFNSSDEILAKLSCLLGELNTDWMEIDFSTWSNKENEKILFNQLKAAILNRNIISFFYVSAKGEKKKRIIEPLRLCFKSNSWYLYGYCRERKDFRFFKLRRIQKFKMLQEFFQREFLGTVFSNNNNGEEVKYIKLKLKLSSGIAYRVYDEFACYEEQQDGSFLVELNCPDGKWLIDYILSFGHNCTVIEPKNMKIKIQQELKMILENYLI